MNEDDLLGLIDAIYAAGLEPTGWKRMLEVLADSVGAQEASLGILTAHAAPWIVAPRTDPDYALTYQQFYHPLNLFWRHLAKHPIGTVATNAMLLTPEQLQTSQFYNEWSAPQGYRTVVGATLAQTAGTRIELQIPGKTEFEPDQVRVVKALAPHLARSARIMQLVAGSRAEKLGYHGAFDMLGHGVLVLDAQSRLQHANTIADEMLVQGTTLRSTDGSIGLAHPAQEQQFRRLFASCVTQTLGAGGRLNIDIDGRPLSILVAPLRGAITGFAFPYGKVLVIITDPHRLQDRRAQVLQRRFGLTPAETAMAIEIAKGDGRAAAAARRNITLSTARTQLSAIFAKTGTTRQAELTRLIADIGD